MTATDPITACVFGATGGIGGALTLALAARDDIARIYAGGRSPPPPGDKLSPFAFDYADEASIAAAAAAMAADPPRLVIVATGALHFPDGAGPERSFRSLDAPRMAQMLHLNAVGPALVAKHVLPLLPREGRSVFAAISARVGSIADNGIGGWHSYRASKAALNMLVRNFAIEMKRTHRESVVVALHPGTVDTPLSAPFQRNLPEGQLTASADAAANLLRVIDALRADDTGGFFAWDGSPIPF
jgi:NAD(P)-dependent dehydrogenase (short-subunit alcohol dehydrogenase family)